MSDPHADLHISIIGGRLGESIVIRTPGGGFGVIDSYASTWEEADQNPTVIRLRDLGAETLRFVALTHPHLDHFRGLPSVFSAYQGRIEWFWRPPMGGQDLTTYLQTLFDEIDAEADDIAREKMARGGWIFRDLFQRAQAEKSRGTMNRRILTNDGFDQEVPTDGILLEEPEHDFSIRCLGPSNDIVGPYTESLIARNFAKGLSGQPISARAPHNEISSVLAITYGGWIGIFGGDTERASWQDIIKRKQQRINSARFFKISHHGSPTGSFDELWAGIQTKTCDAVVTCFAQQKLPNAQGLHGLLRPNFILHSTNKPLAETLYGLRSQEPIPIEFEINREPGEIRINVSQDGAVDIDYVTPAGRLVLPTIPN